MVKVVVENLTKRYGEQTAVDNISFSINSGEIVGFIGPNGAGKNSTMRMITSFMPPTSRRSLSITCQWIETPSMHPMFVFP